MKEIKFTLLYMTLRNYSIQAFTLAEVLITIGIIGIIAALTIPALIQNANEKITVSRVKKAYSVLSQAYLSIREAEGTPDEWGLGDMYDSNSHIIMANKFIPYMKVTTNCVGMNDDDVKKYCTRVTNGIRSYASVRIIDGITIIFRTWYGNCHVKNGNTPMLSNVCGSISIDTNGTAGPDMYGQDIFFFYITKHGILPIGTAEDNRINFRKFCTKDKAWGEGYDAFFNGYGCTAWVIYNENMDYLKCNDLFWNTKTKCKD